MYPLINGPIDGAVDGPLPANREGPRAGHTLIELLMVVVIIGVLASIAVPRVKEALAKALVAQSITQVRAIASDLSIYFMNNGVHALDLSTIGRDNLMDPWGQPYQYLDLSTGEGKPRKDRFLVPINSDFDLYSIGADGETHTNLTVAASDDDVIRAADGKFIGLAKDF